MAASVKTVPFCGESRFSEAEAVEWGLKAAKEAKMSTVIVETDYQE